MFSAIKRWLRRRAAPPQQADANLKEVTPEFLPGLKVLRLTSGELGSLSEEKRDKVRELDGLISDFQIAYSTAVDGFSREQICALGKKLVNMADRIKLELSTSPWMSFKGIDIDDARNTALRVWFRHLPLEAAANGCELVAIADTETTGLQADDEPITVAVILVEVRMPKGELVRVIETYHGKREPSVSISPEAQAVNGLTLDDLRGHAFDSERLERLLRSAKIVVAHNAKFDRRMLRHALVESDRLPWACSMLALRSYWDEKVGRRSLDAICSVLGVGRAEPHNALNDCEALLNALCAHSGKTNRSKSYLAILLDRPWCAEGD